MVSHGRSTGFEEGEREREREGDHTITMFVS